MSWFSVALNWTEQHNGLIQAVGSIGAIAGGFIAVYWQRSREEDEARNLRMMQAFTLAVRLRPFVKEYLVDLQRVERSLGGIPQIRLPDTVKEASGELYVLRDEAPAAIFLYAESQRAELAWDYPGRATLEEQASLAGDPEYRKHMFKSIYGSALKQALAADAEIDRMVKQKVV